ncbi:hypothetical protein KBY90_09620 [Cyanobium sp. CH-040]|nr:hypothetical protein [Cyanobium sp. CH-040]
MGLETSDRPRFRLDTAAAPLQVINGSLSGRAGSHRRPWLQSLHRTADGTLAGLGLCMLALSGLTLHWQNEWAMSFRKLEAAQVLEHRLQEASAQLERHHLGVVGQPGQLVPTSSDKLIFVAPPPRRSGPARAALVPALRWREAAAGY